MAIQYENDQKGSDVNVNIANVDASRQHRKGIQWLQTNSRQYVFLIIMLAAAVVMSVITLAILLTRFQPNNGIVNTNFENSTTTEDNRIIQAVQDSSDKFKIVSRREWLAAPPVEAATPLQLPVPYVFISHTATENCTNQSTCTFHVRTIQSFHIDSKGWWDIGYNFLVGGDGYAYEGRGWKGQGAHTYGYNAKSIGIAFIGSFNNMLPPQRQIIAAQKLIQIGVEKGYLAPNFKLLASRQVQITQSPGTTFYEEIQKWPHWAEKP